MSKENKIVAEPIIPYGSKVWFVSDKKIHHTHLMKNPFSCTTTHFSKRQPERIWDCRVEKQIHQFGYVKITNYTGELEKGISQISVFQKKKFEYLMHQWKRNRNLKSSFLKSLSDRYYQQIIKMGKIALPFIFQQMQKNYDDWFDALYEITKIDPVQKEHYGDFVEMTKDWLKWAKKNKYL